MCGPELQCDRIGGCLKQSTKGWAYPQTCKCEALAAATKAARLRENSIDRKQHLRDIEFLNQNARGK